MNDPPQHYFAMQGNVKLFTCTGETIGLLTMIKYPAHSTPLPLAFIAPSNPSALVRPL